ncbi:hypothetical protein D3C85_1803300 [compost metagenome]
MRSRENQMMCRDGRTQLRRYLDQCSTREIVLRKQRAFQGKPKPVAGCLQRHVGAVKT